MANEKNLKKLEKKTARSSAIGKMGGKKSGEVRREKKTIREIIQIYCDGGLTDEELQQNAELGIPGIANKGLLIAAGIIKRALAGDMRACEMVLNLIGENGKENAIVKKIAAETKLVETQREALLKQMNAGETLNDVNITLNIVDASGGDE